MPRYVVLVDWLAAYILAVARLGNLRTTTLRAWNADEMREIVGRLSQ
jgi:uncharacterized protein with GYD domain